MVYCDRYCARSTIANALLYPNYFLFSLIVTSSTESMALYYSIALEVKWSRFIL